MTNQNSSTAAEFSASYSTIRKIGPDDLKTALANGLEDFKARPSHIILLIIMYPIIAMIAARIAAGYDYFYLVFPMVSGFALVGPLAAIGLYELSRRREQGLDISWIHAIRVIRSPSIGAIVRLSILLGVIYIAWIATAQVIYWMTFGGAVPESIGGFVQEVFTTPAGWTLIIVGCGVGFVFALVVLAISAVSFPMLLDQDVSMMVAVQTSINAFVVNPLTMLMWGFIVAGSLVIGSLPFFIGLAIVMPVLGHATWHLYRKVVVN